VNQKWTCPLLEVEFSIVLDDRLIFSDMHSLPIASSYQNKTLLWKVSTILLDLIEKLTYYFARHEKDSVAES